MSFRAERGISLCVECSLNKDQGEIPRSARNDRQFQSNEGLRLTAPTSQRILYIAYDLRWYVCYDRHIDAG